MNLEHTFHALVATRYQHQFAIAKRLLVDPNDISLNDEIPNGALFTQWLCHRDHDEIFDALDKLGFLSREAAQGSHDNHIHALKIEYPTLGEQLKRKPVSGSVDEQWLIGCFVELADRMGRHNVLGNVRLRGIPIQKNWFAVPAYYDAAMRDIAGAGYCEYENGKAKWLPAVTAIMEARFLWIDGRTVDEIRGARLIEIWDKMPDEVRDLALSGCGYPEPMTLAFLMGHFWNESTGWNFKPGDLDPNTFKTLKGGHLPDAIGISEMVKSGYLH